MSEMRKTGGYMTVEVSAVLPIILMVIWLFFSYLFYFMNCGIAQGIVEEVTQKAADIKITEADYETGKISYARFNQKPFTQNILSLNKSGDIKAEREIKEQFRRHLFMTDVSTVKVSTSLLNTTTKVKITSGVISGRFLSMFGIHIFEYQGNYQTLGNFEMEQIRGWNAVERAMD